MVGVVELTRRKGDIDCSGGYGGKAPPGSQAWQHINGNAGLAGDERIGNLSYCGQSHSGAAHDKLPRLARLCRTRCGGGGEEHRQRRADH